MCRSKRHSGNSVRNDVPCLAAAGDTAYHAVINSSSELFYQKILPFDLLHRVNDGAAGSLHSDGVALFGTQQGLAEGGFLGNDAVHGVGLLRAHDFIGRQGLAAGVSHRDGAADGHLVGGAGVLIHDDDVLQDLLQLGDAGIQLALLVLGLVVLAVLAQVTEAPGDTLYNKELGILMQYVSL